MLEALRAAGGRLIVATSKPEVFAKRIAEHFGFARSLDGVYGADMEGKRSSKIDVIRYAIREQGITPSGAVMVGDRKYDIVGAHEAGLADIGVLYGYGSREELVEAGATRLAASVAELREMLASSAVEDLQPFCASLREGGKIRFRSNRFHLPHKKSHRGAMKPSRCGGYIRIHGTTPASEERYEHLSVGCIAMDDGTGAFGSAVIPDVFGDFLQMSR